MNEKMVHQQPQQQRLHPPSPSSSCFLGLDRLIDDLSRLSTDHRSADIVFIVGSGNNGFELSSESKLYAHRLILSARCPNFRLTENGENPDGIFATTITMDSNVMVVRWPAATPSALSQALMYIYTGKIQFNDDGDELLALLLVAYGLGLQELIILGEERLTGIINSVTACRFLDQTMRMKSVIDDQNWSRLMQICMRFINQTARDCVKTESFLNLTKESIIYLLSSDHFAMDEADVFRSCLEWAKHQTDIRKSPERWTEDERSRIKNQLSGVINHIRILLIDSQVFAEEVEPTGVIPIELSLERYRFAALTIGTKPTMANNNNNKRLQPRITAVSTASSCNRCFPESRILSSDDNFGKYETILNEWYGGGPSTCWRLLYRASDHNFSAEAFHEYCDGHRPTYVLVLGSKGYVSGGFSDVPWSRGNKGRGCYAPSERSFLFRLKSGQDGGSKPPTRFTVTKKMFAIGQMPSKGPVFGAGADLLLADSCHINEDSYSNLPHSYDGPDASVDSLFGSYCFTVVDYEVFTPSSVL